MKNNLKFMSFIWGARKNKKAARRNNHFQASSWRCVVCRGPSMGLEMARYCLNSKWRFWRNFFWQQWDPMWQA